MPVVENIRSSSVPIQSIAVSAYRIPTSSPESDGTNAWTQTTMVLAGVSAGGQTGIGYTYADASAASIIKNILAPTLQSMDAISVPECWITMVRAIRNQGRPGTSS